MSTAAQRASTDGADGTDSAWRRFSSFHLLLGPTAHQFCWASAKRRPPRLVGRGRLTKPQPGSCVPQHRLSEPGAAARIPAQGRDGRPRAQPAASKHARGERVRRAVVKMRHASGLCFRHLFERVPLKLLESGWTDRNNKPLKRNTMNQVQENRMSMAYAAIQVLDQNTLIWNGVPAMVQAHTEFKANLTALEGAVAKQVADIKGHAKDKAAAEEKMIIKALAMAGSVMAFATVNNDNGLADSMDITPSELNRYRDSVVAQRCQTVHDAANTNIVALAAFGILPADVTALQALIDGYVALIPQPRNMITARKGATAEIGALVRDTMKLLTRRIDRLIKQFNFSNPEFVKQYFDARIIIDQHGQKDTSEAVAA